MDRLTKGNGECAWALHNGLWLEPYELAIERDNVHTIGNLMRRLAKYEITGRTPEEIKNAIFPPCKVGDTVYVHTEKINSFLEARKFVEEKKVIAIKVESDGLWIVADDYDSYVSYHIGSKRLFFTREEAEAALGGDANV